MKRKTGYIYRFPVYAVGRKYALMDIETWHRTFNGACKAREKRGGLGQVYRICENERLKKVQG